MNTFKHILILLIDIFIISLFIFLVKDEENINEVKNITYEDIINEIKNDEFERADISPDNRYRVYLKDISKYYILSDQLIEYKKNKYKREIKIMTTCKIEVSTFTLATLWERKEFDDCYILFDVSAYYNRGKYSEASQSLSYFNKKCHAEITDWEEFASYDMKEVFEDE